MRGLSGISALIAASLHWIEILAAVAALTERAAKAEQVGRERKQARHVLCLERAGETYDQTFGFGGGDVARQEP